MEVKAENDLTIGVMLDEEAKGTFVINEDVYGIIVTKNGIKIYEKIDCKGPEVTD